MGTRIEDHLGSQQVARVVYGAIIGMALIVVLEHHPPSAGVTTATLFATAVAVALAELYSDWIGHVLKHRTGFHRKELIEIAKDVSAVAIGIVFPDVFFLLATIGLLELDTAFTVAKWTGLGADHVLRLRGGPAVRRVTEAGRAPGARRHRDRGRADRVQGVRPLAARSGPGAARCGRA